MSESKEASRSWFCVLNNPEKIFGDDKKPDEMVELAIDQWCKDKPESTKSAIKGHHICTWF